LIFFYTGEFFTILYGFLIDFMHAIGEFWPFEGGFDRKKRPDLQGKLGFSCWALKIYKPGFLSLRGNFLMQGF
jgi:hypothetical protein